MASYYRWTLIPAILLLSSGHRTAADTIDNGLTEQPHVECGSESLTVRFKTKSAFEGHSYVKGHYSNPACRIDATLDDSVNLTVPFSDCDVVRQRSSNPRGLYLTTTVVVSFHPMFVTKVDKSFQVQCFYTEDTKTVTQKLDVEVGRNMERNVLVVVGDRNGTEQGKILHRDQLQGDDPNFKGPVHDDDITLSAPLPECRYQVLSVTKDGEPVKFATVGQPVYHQWSCADKNGNSSVASAYCATVHSCNVKEEGGRQVQLLDENGCAVDKYLLNNLEYTADLVGGQQSQVFKFADQPSLFFQCQIRLSLKEDGVCKRSSDHCPVTVRGKRSTDASANDVDVLSQKMTVFDIDDPVSSTAARDLTTTSSWTNGDLCISPIGAGVILAMLASTILVSIISVALLCCRPHTVKVSLMG